MTVSAIIKTQFYVFVKRRLKAFLFFFSALFSRACLQLGKFILNFDLLLNCGARVVK